MGIEAGERSEFENEPIEFLYHHSRPFEHSPYDVVSQVRETDTFFDGAYQWLEKEVGFYPLFLAVGTKEEDIKMTGYQQQWKRILSKGKDFTEYKKKGDIDNTVLFSFSEVTDGIFMDYIDWHHVLNSSHNNYSVNKWAKKLIFHPTWDKDRWLDYAKDNPHTVQLVVPELDLRESQSVWVRNKDTQRKLQGKGFTNVSVQRLGVNVW